VVTTEDVGQPAQFADQTVTRTVTTEDTGTVREVPDQIVQIAVDAANAESALDQIADDAQDADLNATGTATVNAGQARSALAGVKSQANSTHPNVAGRIKIAGGAAAGAVLAKVRSQANAAGAALNRIGGRTLKWGGAALAAGLGAASYLTVKLGANMEQTRLQFRTMLGDVAKGDAALNMLNEFSNVTPFSNMEVVGAGKKLLAFGVPAQQLQDILKMTGDVSAGTGKDFQELSGIVGKVFAKGKADSEALNQMVEAGVPIIKVLGQQYGKSGAEVYKMAEKGQISSQMMIAAYQNMTAEGGVFEDMMAKQAGTLGGQWSTIIGKIQLTAATLGEQLTPALTAGLDYLMQWVDRLGALAENGDAFDAIADGALKGAAAMGQVLIWFNRIYQGGAAVFKTLKNIATAQLEGIQFLFSGLVVGIVDGLGWVLNKAIAIINKARAIVHKKPLAFKFDTNSLPGMAALRQWRDSSGQMAKDALKDIPKVWRDAMDSDTNMTTGVEKTLDKVRGKIEAIRKDAKIKIQEKADAGELTGSTEVETPDAPEVPETDPVKIKSEVETPDVDELTKIGMYNFSSVAPLAVRKAMAGPMDQGKTAPAGTTAPAVVRTTSQPAKPVVPPTPKIDIERNTLLKKILDAVSEPETVEVLAL
jgi:tape measure domain-containing protein